MTEKIQIDEQLRKSMVRDNSVMLMPTAKVGDALIPNTITDQDSGEFERAEGENIGNQNY